MNIFGKKLKNIHYTQRPGAYAVIFKDNKIATVKTPSGYFLPGGGIDPGEDPEKALKRECLEELGTTISIIKKLGTAQQYFQAPSNEKYYLSEATFYLAKFSGQTNDISEEDHSLIWLSLDEAKEYMFHEHQAWAIKETKILS